jgi:hypothetical protein
VTPDQTVLLFAKYAKKEKVIYNKWKLLTGPKEEIQPR